MKKLVATEESQNKIPEKFWKNCKKIWKKLEKLKNNFRKRWDKFDEKFFKTCFSKKFTFNLHN